MHIMAVDDEKLALSEFKDTCDEIGGIDSVTLFSNPLEALSFAAKNKVDIAFLDMEMPVVRGIEMAKRLNRISPNIKIVFVTGYAQFAIDAFGVDAVDYVLKPYDTEMIRRALEKASYIKDKDEDARTQIKTFGFFDVFVGGKPVAFSSSKAKELLALLVDRNGGLVSTEQAISVLWSDRKYDEAVQSLFRKVLRSLRNTLEEAGIADIFVDNRNQRGVDPAKFSCDYYDVLNNREGVREEFFGKYMSQYPWARETEKLIGEMCKTQQ